MHGFCDDPNSLGIIGKTKSADLEQIALFISIFFFAQCISLWSKNEHENNLVEYTDGNYGIVASTEFHWFFHMCFWTL